MNKEFFTNQINELEEYLVDLGVATSDVTKYLDISPEKREDFPKL